MSLRGLRGLSQKQLKDVALLCGGVAVLLFAAVFISQVPVDGTPLASNLSQSQAAATALGDSQGIPSGYTGSTYTADPTCWVNWSYASYGPNWGPLCPTIGNSNFGSGTSPDQDTFSSGVFSVDLGSGRGQSVNTTRTVTATYDQSAAVIASCSKNGCFYSCPSGYALHTGSKGATPTCSKTIAGSMAAPVSNAVGSQVYVYPSQTVTFEWSCLPSRTVYAEYKSGGGWLSVAQWYSVFVYSYGLASSVTGSGTGFTPSGLYGTQSVTAPSTTGTYNYSLTCNGGTNAMTIPVIVSPAPAVTITGNGSNPFTAVPGQAVSIVGTFTAGVGDTLVQTALNDYQNNALPGVAWTPPTNKSYTFTPATTGSYIFYPAVQTSKFPGWNNYNKSLTVNVVAQCPNGSGPTGSCTACNSGYVIQGTAPSNSCVPQCPNGTGPAGSCLTCNSGFVPSGGNCVAQCVHGTGADGNCATCDNGFVLTNGYCVVPPPPSIVSQLTATPAHVRTGSSTSLSWTTVSMTSCTVKNDSGTTLSTASTSPGLLSGPLTHKTTFTLSCTDGTTIYTSTVTVPLVPLIQEI